MKLETDHLALGYGPTIVIPDLTYRVREGQVTSLVGRNGCGKSTLLRAMGRLLRPLQGAVVLDGKAVTDIPTRQLARRLAVLAQGPIAPDGVTVRNLVEHGRYPHRGFLSSGGDHDRRVVAWALQQTRLTELADRPLVQLSGGQRQAAWIAMALAQDTEVILLDEPTTFLDVAHQIELMELLRGLNREHGKTILMVLHDLNQAARYSDELVAVKEGRVYATGPPGQVLTQAMISDVFGIQADVISDPRTGAPLCIPYAPGPAAAGDGRIPAPAASEVRDG